MKTRKRVLNTIMDSNECLRRENDDLERRLHDVTAERDTYERQNAVHETMSRALEADNEALKKANKSLGQAKWDELRNAVQDRDRLIDFCRSAGIRVVLEAYDKYLAEK